MCWKEMGLGNVNGKRIIWKTTSSYLHQSLCKGLSWFLSFVFKITFFGKKITARAKCSTNIFLEIFVESWERSWRALTLTRPYGCSRMRRTNNSCTSLWGEKKQQQILATSWSPPSVLLSSSSSSSSGLVWHNCAFHSQITSNHFTEMQHQPRFCYSTSKHYFSPKKFDFQRAWRSQVRRRRWQLCNHHRQASVRSHVVDKYSCECCEDYTAAKKPSWNCNYVCSVPRGPASCLARLSLRAAEAALFVIFHVR